MSNSSISAHSWARPTSVEKGPASLSSATASSRRAPAEAHTREVGPGSDPKLGEDFAQVIVDRAWAEEELCPDLAVGQALGSEPGDLQLLRSELAERGRVP